MFSAQTTKIINAHAKDFNSSNYSAKIKAAGGYTAYVKSLGGIFSAWVNRTGTVKTVSDFRSCAEYVCGLMAVWGFDYNNGSTYWHWGSGSTGKPASDAFYQKGQGNCNTGTISELCQGTGGRSRTTNCNFGLDTLLKAAGLYKTASCYFKSWATKYGKPVKNKADLKPGDMVHFFGKSVVRITPSTWGNGSWKHVAIVYSVDKAAKKIWLVDFGGRFIRSKKPLHYMTIDSSANAGGEYSNYYWAAVHAFDLKEDAQPIKTKTDADLAVETLAGLHGSGEARKKALGSRYDAVQKLVNEYLRDKDAYIRACAAYALEGYAGAGDARKKFFGADYEAVQAKINRTIGAAKDVLAGKYGAGEDRKKALGADYDLVQAQVNRTLKEG